MIRRRESAEHLIRPIVIPAGALRRDMKYIFTPALQAKEEHRACARENWPEKKNGAREDKVLSFSERKGKQKAAEKKLNKAEGREQICARARISVCYQLRSASCFFLLHFPPALTYQSGPGVQGAEQRGQESCQLICSDGCGARQN